MESSSHQKQPCPFASNSILVPSTTICVSSVWQALNSCPRFILAYSSILSHPVFLFVRRLALEFLFRWGDWRVSQLAFLFCSLRFGDLRCFGPCDYSQLSLDFCKHLGLWCRSTCKPYSSTVWAAISSQKPSYFFVHKRFLLDHRSFYQQYSRALHLSLRHLSESDVALQLQAKRRPL